MYGPIAAFESYICGALRFNARAARSEFWWPSALVLGVITLAGLADIRSVADGFIQTGQPPMHVLAYWSPLLWIAFFVPTLSAMVRRLHDTGRSGWWLLVQIIPLLGPMLIFGFLLMPSKPEPNAWGAPRSASTARKAKPRRAAGPLDAYAVLLQAHAEPSPEEVARRKEEVHDYFVRNVSRSGAA
ncbi:DUF805 domain-containing protein [Salipiger sp. 1_MG-2023]|uniref:DUF805 domain-containing protein n=1 Tax=Salipiger sp. 1_MG-2023 TaxID=3062665 RepID=UPI0026E3799C|nr:DUF805 domain-containing protein [Salipiger sp. 1_MG-2023]MDO6585595.1 DUF805 domain-containing protein [Salipiger sp. 1_MG-2023]